MAPKWEAAYRDTLDASDARGHARIVITSFLDDLLEAGEDDEVDVPHELVVALRLARKDLAERQRCYLHIAAKLKETGEARFQKTGTSREET